MGQGVFRADRRYGLCRGIKFDAVVLPVTSDDLLAETSNTLRLRISMVARVANGFNRLINNRSGRGSVRISHPEIDDILLVCPQPSLHFVHNSEHVRRQLAYTIELVRGQRHRDIVVTPATLPRNAFYCVLPLLSLPS
jgi:hypothetical protein